jgi:hypothetical protein
MARHARGDRTTRVEQHGPSDSTSTWLHTHKGPIDKLLRNVSSYLRNGLQPLPPATPRHSRPPRYRLNPDSTTAPWTASMTTSLYKTSSVPSPSAYLVAPPPAGHLRQQGNSLRQFFALCHEEQINPLNITTQSMVRCTTWLGMQGTVATASLQ